TNDKKAAKYLNSPESELYHKSKVLYGIFYAKQAIAKEDNCYLVEGYTDVIQMHQSGIENVVSSSGTSLTTEQIRLISRLTKNITVLFDGDAAGMRASIRGIDLILEQGMNVKVCVFPDGEDPDSFARKNSQADMQEYLLENAKDFIEFKASLLYEDAKHDPVKRANLIQDMVSSISKIPNQIQQEVYIQECSRIMDISENVLFNTLSQILAREGKASGIQPKKPQAMEVVRTPEAVKTKVDELFELERKIISLLMLYGTAEEEFEDLVLKENDKGELVMEPEIQKARVFEKIYLDLQEDEVAFTNEKFRELYSKIISLLNTEGEVNIEKFVNGLDSDLSTEVTTLLMEEEQYRLHEWERMNIMVKTKETTIARLVGETILALRRFLISQKIDDLSNKIKESNDENTRESMEDIMDYLSLKKVLSNKLNRVM
ncbi:MAG TPA: toprim domain-containing protein, partial [Gillisia sp.]|nr:toprim domain-containing protein [Gillisia sp.]